jgi:fructose-specific phosphotransferase system IIC component
MTDKNQKTELKGYADGWITERKGTAIPGFLKLAYPVIGLAILAYIVIYMNGEVTHSTRGILVQQLNAVTGTANSFMYVVGAMIVVYLVILLAYLFKNSEHEE